MTQKNMVRFKRLQDTATGNYRDYTYPAYTDIPFDPEKDAYPYPSEAADMTYDGLHPSDKGNQVIAGMLAPLLVTAAQQCRQTAFPHDRKGFVWGKSVSERVNIG